MKKNSREFSRNENLAGLCATTGKSCAKKRVPFSYINVSLLPNFGVYFLSKTDFGPKKCFSTKRKNGCFFVVPARTKSVVIVGHFLMALMVPPSFVDDGQKFVVGWLVGWLVGWWLWCAGCISQDTYLLYLLLISAVHGPLAE